MSYIGHGLSHAIFGGFAASALLGVNFLLGAGVWGVASALMINGVTRRRVIGADAAIGVITTASFALGLALFARLRAARAELRRGAVRQHPRRRAGQDVLVDRVRHASLAARARLLRATARCCSRRSTPRSPRRRASAPPRVDALLMVVLAASILATMQVLGVTLIAATLVIPATVARMLTNSFSRMLWLATGIGAVCGFVGMNLSYHLDVQSGPTIVLVGAALFAIVFVVTGPRRLRGAAGPRRAAIS